MIYFTVSDVRHVLTLTDVGNVNTRKISSNSSRITLIYAQRCLENLPHLTAFYNSPKQVKAQFNASLQPSMRQ